MPKQTLGEDTRMDENQKPSQSKDEVWQQVGESPTPEGGARELGATALLSAIDRHRLRASQLLALYNQLPRKLSAEADEMLWLLVIREGSD